MMMKIVFNLAQKPATPFLFLILFISSLFYKLFLFGHIPFPGDLLIGSYYPWLDYFKQPVQNPLISDVFSQFIIWKYLSIESFTNLTWPLWNPYSFTGNSLLATYHSATLYPLNILLLLPEYYGWGFFIYSQTLIASLTFYIFISELIRSRLARLTGAIIFALSSLMTTWLEFGTAVHAISWLPLSLFAIIKFNRSQKYRYLILLICTLSLTILAGNAQISTYSYLLTILYVIWINLEGLTIKKVGLPFLAIFFSLIVCAIQLFPSYQALQGSIRSTENYTKEGNFGLLNTTDFIKFFNADYFGNPVTRNYWGNLNYSETSGFLGTLTLTLIIFSILKIKNRQSFFFGSLFIATIILGFDNPISRLIYQTQIPLLTASYASRILFLTILSSSILASLALDQLSKDSNLHFFSKITIGFWMIVSGILLGTLIATILMGGFSNPEKGQYLTNYIVSSKNSLLPFIILSFFLILIFIINQTKLSDKNKLTCILLTVFILITLDLSRYFLKFNPFTPNHLVFPKTPITNFLQNQTGIFRVGREHAEVLPPNTWTAYKLQSYEGYDPIYSNRYGQFMHFLNGGDIRTGNSSRYAELSGKFPNSFMNSLNVKYFVAISDNMVEETGYKKVFEDKSTQVLENPNFTERAYFAQEIITTNVQEAKDIFMNQSFNPQKTTILTRELMIKNVDGKGKIEIINYEPNLIEINTSTESDQILVLSDQFDEGWSAVLDNQYHLDISPANLIFRAVKAPSGNHSITFKYLPDSFRIGLKISTISIFLLILLGIFCVYKKKF